MSFGSTTEEARGTGTGLGRPAVKRSQNLALGRLAAAADPKVSDIPATAGTWLESELVYYSIPLGSRHTAAVAISSTLKALEEKVLGNPTDLGAYSAKVGPLAVVDPDWGIETAELGAVRRLPGAETFLARRRELFRAIRGPAGSELHRDGGLVQRPDIQDAHVRPRPSGARAPGACRGPLGRGATDRRAPPAD